MNKKLKPKKVKLSIFISSELSRELKSEAGVLYLRWPDGRQQKVTLSESTRVQ
jgi:hypothetical protein